MTDLAPRPGGAGSSPVPLQPLVPMQPLERAAALFDAGVAAVEASLAEAAVFRAGVESRLARLRQADALERAGRHDEAAVVLRGVMAETSDVPGGAA